ncbi:hypothetical protein NC651_026626 [Populus alba x Populus x berolinensis]|nr:hypothetical protein NC651_026626 [Populus alba x Populus x berolinensis]
MDLYDIKLLMGLQVLTIYRLQIWSFATLARLLMDGRDEGEGFCLIGRSAQHAGESRWRLPKTLFRHCC